MVICIDCDKEYKTKYTLKIHQSGKACVKNKPLTDNIIYDCNLCGKELSSKRNLNKHKTLCIMKKELEIKTHTKLKMELLILKEKNIQQSLEILELKTLVKELRSRPTTVINNNDNSVNNKNINITIKNYITESPECVSLKVIESYIPKLTHHHILDGGAGYARFVLDIMSKRMRMVTKNEARGIVVYKDENKRLKTDVGLHDFIVLFASAVKKPVKEIVESLMYSYNEIADESDEETLKQLAVYAKHIRDISKASQGKTASFMPSMVKGITSGTLSSNLDR